MKILLTGASGMVGSRLNSLLASSFTIIAPSRLELDITKKSDGIKTMKPDLIIHSAAFTNVSAAEDERGDKKGSCWRVNVEGTKQILTWAKQIGARVLFLSTGSVFSSETNRLFTEDDTPSPDDALSWYGITKKEAEKLVLQEQKHVVIRISHPISHISGVGEDYLHTMLTTYQKGELYPLFRDQIFSITLIEDLATAILSLITRKAGGIFHVTSTDTCSPYAVMSHATGKKDAITAMNFADFLQTQDAPKRYSQYSILDSTKTRKRLGLTERSWREIVDIAL